MRKQIILPVLKHSNLFLQSLSICWDDLFVYLFIYLALSNMDRDTATAKANYCGPGIYGIYCSVRLYPEGIPPN